MKIYNRVGLGVLIMSSNAMAALLVLSWLMPTAKPVVDANNFIIGSIFMLLGFILLIVD